MPPSGFRTYGGSTFRRGGSGSVVKGLLVANVALFLLNFLLSMPFGDRVFYWLQLTPAEVVRHFAVWQLFTYQFLHDLESLFHLIFNMLALWMFGRELEATWGGRKFLQYYLTCGVGAGICIVLIAYLFGSENVPVIGASGALFGVILAFAMLFPSVQLIFFFFPISARWLVVILGAVSLFSLMRGNNVLGNLAHLGGLLVGFLYMRIEGISQYSPRGSSRRSLTSRLNDMYQQWKRDRAKRKFEVYMRKHDRTKFH